MGKGRLEAFSDGVIAIIITIMVLELAPPEGAGIEDLVKLAPTFFAYILSFAFVGIYWMNHHHLLQAAKHVSHAVLLANLALLFWLSLVPFGTAWMGDSGFAATPTAVYGAILWIAGAAYYTLERMLVRAQPADHGLGEALANPAKGRLSLLAYGASIPLAFVAPAISLVVFIVMAGVWFVPDRKIERVILQ